MDPSRSGEFLRDQKLEERARYNMTSALPHGPKEPLFPSGKNPAKATPSSWITLQVGGRQFTTLRETLCRSPYFAAQLFRLGNRGNNGKYFVDANPDMFEHVLAYLRTGIFPIFFDPVVREFDHGKYIALLAEARYFGVQRLVDWIADRGYLKAVQLKTKFLPITALNNEIEFTRGGNFQVQMWEDWGRGGQYKPAGGGPGMGHTGREYYGAGDTVSRPAIICLSEVLLNPKACYGELPSNMRKHSV